MPRAADFQHMPAARLAPEVMIEGDDPVNFGTGAIQGFGDERHGEIADKAKLFVERMQNWEQRTFQAEMFGNNLARAAFVKDGRLGHVSTITLISFAAVSPREFLPDLPPRNSALPIDALPFLSVCVPQAFGILIELAKKCKLPPGEIDKAVRRAIGFFYQSSLIK